MTGILIDNIDTWTDTHVHGPQWLKNISQVLIFWNWRFYYETILILYHCVWFQTSNVWFQTLDIWQSNVQYTANFTLLSEKPFMIYDLHTVWIYLDYAVEYTNRHLLCDAFRNSCTVIYPRRKWLAILSVVLCNSPCLQQGIKPVLPSTWNSNNVVVIYRKSELETP